MITKEILNNWKPQGKRFLNYLKKDGLIKLQKIKLLILKIKNYQEVALDREGWKKRVMKRWT